MKESFDKKEKKKEEYKESLNKEKQEDFDLVKINQEFENINSLSNQEFNSKKEKEEIEIEKIKESVDLPKKKVDQIKKELDIDERFRKL